MKKHTDVIVINGRTYHAGTGELLAHDGRAAGAHPRAAHTPAGRPASAPMARQAAAPKRPSAHRQAARNRTAHPRTRTRTLMRQGVKKPAPSLKRHVRIQGYLDAPAGLSPRLHAAPAARRQARPAKQHPDVRTSQSQLISHFSPRLFTVEHVTLLIEPPVPAPAARPRQAAARTMEPVRRRPLTTDELLEFAVQQARVPIEPLPRRRRVFRGHVAVR